MKKALVIFALLVMVVGFTSAQTMMNYGYEGPFPDTTVFDLSDAIAVVNGGLGVDPEGKVWIQSYTTGSLDSIDTGGGVYASTRPIYVFNPDGSQASFSPISVLTGLDETGATVTDTLLTDKLGYGGSINPANGNFLAVWSLGTVWEVNYMTGAGVRYTSPAAGILANSPASVAANSAGEIYLARVLSAGPGQILNPDFTAGTQFAADVPDIGRTITVSGDGNDVYVPRFTGNVRTYVYHSDNGSLGPYTFKDSILAGWSVETIGWHPTTGYLWVAADRRSDSLFHTMYSANSFYALDVANNYAVVDSFNVAAWPAADVLPRGMAFSPTGDTVYVGKFDGSGIPAVHRFIAGFSTSVQRIDDAVPSGYALQQNFPNPFNPSTEIRFDIGQAGFTTLRVYDMLGREVAQLVNQELEAGTFTATFNASDLPSGTYVYEVVSGGVRLTKKMMLLK